MFGLFVNPLQDGLFQGWSKIGRGAKRPHLPKICYTYPTMMKLGSYTLPKEVPKTMNHVTHPLSSTDSNFFYRKSANFAISRNIDIL